MSSLSQRRFRWSWYVPVASLLLLLFAAPASAQASRTWVSGVGDDANPCSRTAPCKTFAGAISKTAAGGEINVLDPGGFGAVTITKSITISSEDIEAGILVSGTNGIIVNAPANAVVVLRGLDFEGLGTGLTAVRFFAGSALVIENCTFDNFTQKAISFEPSGASQLFVSDTQIRNKQSGGNSSGAIIIKPTGTGSARASIDNVRMENNLFGLRVEGGSSTTVNRTIATGSSNIGFLAVGTAVGPTSLNIESSVASENATDGVRAQSGAIIRLSNTMVTDNAGFGLVTVTGGEIVSFGNNRVAGNGTNGAPTSTVPQV